MEDQRYLKYRAHEMVAKYFVITKDLEMAKECAKACVQEVLNVRPNVPYKFKETQYEEARLFWESMVPAIESIDFISTNPRVFLVED